MDFLIERIAHPIRSILCNKGVLQPFFWVGLIFMEISVRAWYNMRSKNFNLKGANYDYSKRI